MQKDRKLFRDEALAAQQQKWLGEIILIRPVSFLFFTLFAVVIASIVIIFLIWGGYTKRSTVTGQLVPSTGLVKVYSPQPGVVLEKKVTEGQAVKRGDILFVLSSERHSSTQGETQAAISRQLLLRQQSLREEIKKTQVLQEEEQRTLEKKVQDLQAEISKFDRQIELQKAKISFAEETVKRYQGLLTRDYISKEQLQQKNEELLDQQNILQSLEREKNSFFRELAEQRHALKGLPLKHHNQLAVIERDIAWLTQELTESEAKRHLTITATEAGIATAVIAELGQVVTTNNPLVSIVPHSAHFQAHLYSPSRAMGFVQPGQAVLLRYQAYPYQKFGHHKGTVQAVSRTALPSSEISPISNGNNEPLYRITVNLNSQVVTAYGKIQPLQAGMLLEADILQDSRRLYEWVLEPLYSITGKI